MEENSLVAKSDIDRWSAVTNVVAECSLDAIGKMEPIEQQLRMARGLAQLRKLITPQMLQDLMSLQNSALGFKTDKPDDGYPIEVVRDVAIESLVRAARMVGNEVNIIGGNFYATKAFFVRKLREFPGLTNLERTLQPPRQAGEKGALVNCSASWLLNGIPQKLAPRDIPVRVNSGMGADAILGKAHRKLDAAIYSQITGSEWAEGDADEVRAERATNITPPKEDAPADTRSKSEKLAEAVQATGETIEVKATAAAEPKAQEKPQPKTEQKPAANGAGESAGLGF